MGYYINLSRVSLASYEKYLHTADLLPSRQILQDEIAGKFESLAKHGIRNVEELLNALKTKPKVEALQSSTGIDREYLLILARELKSYHPKPVKLRDFQSIDLAMVDRLEAHGYKTTFQLYEKVLTAWDRKALAEKLSIDSVQLEYLAHLCDLCRVKWVNHTFAYVLYHSGYPSSADVAKATPDEMYQAVRRYNEEHKVYKGNIGIHDMKLCIEFAADLD